MPVGFSIASGISSRYPSASSRNNVASKCCPRDPDLVSTNASSDGSTAGFATMCIPSVSSFPTVIENNSPLLPVDLKMYPREPFFRLVRNTRQHPRRRRRRHPTLCRADEYPMIRAKLSPKALARNRDLPARDHERRLNPQYLPHF